MWYSILRMKYFKRGITSKKNALVYDAGRPCWIRRGKAAIRLAFLTVSDGCWLYIYFLFAARIDSVYPIAIFSVYIALRERYCCGIFIPSVVPSSLYRYMRISELSAKHCSEISNVFIRKKQGDFKLIHWYKNSLQ